jgi:hypothetical protein
MTNQQGFLAVAAIQPGHLEALVELLREVDRDARAPRQNPIVPFHACETIHFCRFVVFHPDIDARGNPIAPTLAFSTNYDEPLDAHLAEVAQAWQTGLRHIYAHCEGFPAHATSEQIVAFLKSHSVPYAAFYVGTLGRTVAQIRDEARLRCEIEQFLDEEQRRGTDWPALSPAAIRARIQQFVGNRPELAWSLTPPSQSLASRLNWFRPLALAVAVILAILIGSLALGVFGWLILLVATGALAWWLVLRRNETHDREHPVNYTNDPEDKKKIKRLVEAEDRIVQNQFTSINPIKAQPLRLVTLRAVLFFINAFGRYAASVGHLSDIRSIHFARWVILDGGRRLAFFSNFDGSWENYLGDFVDRAATGLTAIWSNTADFPPARNLIHEGAKDEQPFKAVARHYQAHTDVWYSAYPELTTTNINNNTAIRRGLSGEMTEDQIRIWLKRL